MRQNDLGDELMDSLHLLDSHGETGVLITEHDNWMKDGFLNHVWGIPLHSEFTSVLDGDQGRGHEAIDPGGCRSN